MSLTVCHTGITEKGIKLNAGDTVTYDGHIPGGMVSIIFENGDKDIAHPHCFLELLPGLPYSQK